MEWLKQLDWQMVGFVGASLVNEWFAQVHMPKIEYWNGQKEQRNRDKAA